MAPVQTSSAAITWVILISISDITYGESATEGSYVGCFKDEGYPRDFAGYAENFNDLTPKKCNEFCYSKGYLYSATQGSSFCFCNDKHPSPNFKVSEERCSKPCSGDPSEKCGDERSISVYKTSISDFLEVNNYIGCFDDHSRLLTNVSVNFERTNSPRRCMNYCLQLGYHYSGVQYGRECKCGDSEPDHQNSRSVEECNWPCSGDPEETCGGNWRMDVYSTNATEFDSQTSNEVGKYLGCYKALSNLGKPSYTENLEDLRLEECTNICDAKGYLYSWTHNGTFCFCGDKRPHPRHKIGEDQCSKQCGGNSDQKCGSETAVSLRETGIPDFSDVGKYVGCFADYTRILNEVWINLDWTNSPKRCMNICLKMGYQYSGVQYSRECRCGNNKPDLKHESEDECNWSCTGDRHQTCGGFWRTAIYATKPNPNGGAAQNVTAGNETRHNL